MPFLRLPICLLTLVAALQSSFAVAHASYDYGFDRNTILKRQTSDIYPVTGIQTSSGTNESVPLRREIRQLEQDNITWNLYILGLDLLQYTNQTEMLSWYQIAGTSVLNPSWRTTANYSSRNSRTTLGAFQWCRAHLRKRGQWILHSSLDYISNLAPPISRSVRTSAV